MNTILNQQKEAEMEKKMAGGCPSCASPGAAVEAEKKENRDERVLSQWPIQIKLMGTAVPFLEGADLLVASSSSAVPSSTARSPTLTSSRRCLQTTT
jgi:hypothetical protein